MKGLLSVSFGTSYVQTRKRTIDAVEARLADAFPERAFYSAWTSGRIIAKVRAERGEEHDTLDEAFARLSDDGVDDLIVSTMCLMDGHEMGKIENAAAAWAQADEKRVARVASPLLASSEDRRAMAQAICDEFAAVSSEDVLLLMGHGISRNLKVALMEHDDQHDDPNAVYGQIQDELHALGRVRFFVATVEGVPVFEDALAAIEACGAKRVHLAPFMIVAGDHATNDLAGDDEDSWKSMLEACGYSTDVTLKGLGEYEGVQQLVCAHAHAARVLER